MMNYINSIADIVVPLLVKINLQIIPFFVIIFLISKWLVKKDLEMAYGIWWLLILKFFLPFNLFTYQKELPVKITNTHLIFSDFGNVANTNNVRDTFDSLSTNAIILIGYFSIAAILILFYFYKKHSLNKLIVRNLSHHETIENIIKKIKTTLYVPANLKIFQIDGDFACTTGIFEPLILLPENILQKPESDIESIILHELIHIKKNDSLTFSFLQILKMVFWFNPLFRVMMREMHFLQEMICDQQVLSTRMLDKKSYGMAIINFNNVKQESILNPNFAKSSKTLFLRIKQLNRRKKMKTSMKFLTTFCVMMMLMVNVDLSAKPGGEKFVRPVKVGYVSSRFGMRKHPISGEMKHHDGIDIAAPKGTPVYAPKSGVVTFAKFKKNYGFTVIIQHDNTKTVYAQLSKILVTEGEKVTQDKVIGKVGSSGISTGPHLHFEIRENDKPVNPENYIDFSS